MSHDSFQSKFLIYLIKEKALGSKMKSGLEFKLSCKKIFDFSKFSSKFEPTVI